MLVLPFSTDQFAGAAAIERLGIGEALDPNAASIDEVREALERLLAADRTESAALAASLQAMSGRERAFAAMSSSMSRRI